MVYLGKNVDDKILKKIENYLVQLLDDDEKILAVINATRFSSPAINGLVLTNHRILLAKKPFVVKIEFYDEIAADDILEFSSDKGLLKARKLFVTKKDGTKLFLGSSHKEDVELASSLLPKMSGAPILLAEKIIATKNAEIAAKKQDELEKEKQKMKEKEANKLLQENEKKTNQIIKESEKEANKLAKQELKNAKIAAAMARGRELGYVQVNYVGGYNSDLKKSSFTDFLSCYENEIIFKKRDIAIPANQIVSFEITGKEQTNSRISITRMATLGVFSLAAPKRSTKKEANIYIGLKDGRLVMFNTESHSESEVHKKLANAISHYSSLLNSHETQQLAPSTVDVAGEIVRFAELRKQGLLTDDEFEAKKKQLLSL